MPAARSGPSDLTGMPRAHRQCPAVALRWLTELRAAELRDSVGRPQMHMAWACPQVADGSSRKTPAAMPASQPAASAPRRMSAWSFRQHRPKPRSVQSEAPNGRETGPDHSGDPPLQAHPDRLEPAQQGPHRPGLQAGQRWHHVLVGPGYRQPQRPKPATEADSADGCRPGQSERDSWPAGRSCEVEVGPYPYSGRLT